ncbi:MAG: AAA family ATPase, partial [Planctomycetes bacterium]|nr:AAA family ATPase [Planctomycetota bacterium]
MLEEIVVENLRLIDRLPVTLHPGLNVISGETGVGKSMFLSAVGLLFGGSMDEAMDPAREARVEGRFRWRPEDRHLIPDSIPDRDESEMVVRVCRKPGGAQRCYLNGSMVSRRELTALGSRLVDVHGQRDMQRLLAPREQVAVLDRFAGCEDAALAFADHHAEVERLRETATRRAETERSLRDRVELLRFQVQELDQAQLQTGELADLDRRFRIVSHAEETLRALSKMTGLLEDEGTAAECLGQAGAVLQRAGEDDDEVSELADRCFNLAEAV